MDSEAKKKYTIWVLKELSDDPKKIYNHYQLYDKLGGKIGWQPFLVLIDELFQQGYTNPDIDDIQITTAGIEYYQMLLADESEKLSDKNLKEKDSELKHKTSKRQTIFNITTASIAALSVFINVYNSSLKNGNVVNAEKLEMMQDKILNLETRIDSLFSIITKQDSIPQSTEVVLDTARTKKELPKR